ncbi:MAG: HEAT repeat domain-containing protein [Phycisphaerae bacterium]
MLCRKRYRPSVQWLLVFVVSPLLLTSACAPAKETSKEPGKPTAAWPSDADGALLACVSKDRTGAFQFDRYMTVQQAEPRHHKPDLRYYPELKGEYVRQYAFRCLDDEGNVLYELPFTHDYTAAVKTGGQSGCIIYMLESHASFMEWLPLSSRTRVLQFVEGGKVVAEKRRSPHPPEVRLGSARIQADGKVSVPWSVEDKDDRELSMKLAFHDPDGQHLLAEALRLVLAPRPHVNGHSEDAYTQGYGSPEVGPDFMEFDATVFQGGKGCRLEVAVSDGINWTTAVSEPFDTSSRVPGIRIVKPKQGAIFTQDETVDLWAGRTDGGPPLPFDGVTYRDGKPYRLVWSSSIDGKLAEDNVVDVRGLSAGEHVITAEVTGRSGEAAKASTRITVLPMPFPEVGIDPDSAEDSRMKVLSTLLPWLSDEDPTQRLRGARAIALLGPEPDHVPNLVQALTAEIQARPADARHEESRLHNNIILDLVVALGKLGPQAAMAVPEIVTVLNMDEEPEATEVAMEALRQIGEPAVPLLLEQLREGDLQARRNAAWALERMEPSAAAVDPLIQALADEKVRPFAVPALRQMKGIAVPALLTALESEDAGIREGTCQALQQANDPMVAPRLLDLYKREKNSHVRHEAACAIAHSGYAGADAVGALTEALGDSNERTRYLAASRLGDTGTSDAVEPLLKATKDKSLRVRRNAAISLGDLGPNAAAAVPVLQELKASDPERSVRYVAEKALARIQGRR